MHPSGSNPASSSPSQPMRFTSMCAPPLRAVRACTARHAFSRPGQFGQWPLSKCCTAPTTPTAVHPPARRARRVPGAFHARRPGGGGVLRAAVAFARVHPRVAEDRLELVRGVDAGAVERRAPRLVLGVLQVRRDGAGAVKHADDLRLPVVRGRATEVEHARVGIVLALRVSVGARDVADVGHGEDHGARALGARARGSPGEVRGRTTTSRFPGEIPIEMSPASARLEWQQSLLGVSFAIKSRLPACSHSHSHLQKMMTEYVISLTQHPPPAGSGPTRFPAGYTRRSLPPARVTLARATSSLAAPDGSLSPRRAGFGGGAPGADRPRRARAPVARRRGGGRGALSASSSSARAPAVHAQAAPPRASPRRAPPAVADRAPGGGGGHGPRGKRRRRGETRGGLRRARRGLRGEARHREDPRSGGETARGVVQRRGGGRGAREGT